MEYWLSGNKISHHMDCVYTSKANWTISVAHKEIPTEGRKCKLCMNPYAEWKRKKLNDKKSMTLEYILKGLKDLDLNKID